MNLSKCKQMSNDELVERGADIRVDFGDGIDTCYVSDPSKVFDSEYITLHYLDGIQIHVSNGKAAMWIDHRKCTDKFVKMDKEFKTRYKHVSFDETIKGVWYCCHNKHDADMGKATYYGRWKQWVMEFENDRIFNEQCLIDIADFLSQLNRRLK